IDIDRCLESQGPFDLILHKCTGLMVKAAEGNTTAIQQIQNIKSYVKNHPSCILVDPFDSIKKLIDRNEQYKLLLQCHLLDSDSSVFTPSFVELTTTDVVTNRQRLKEAHVSFPFVCKPTQAHGTSLSHQMAIIFDEDGLKDVQPPCVAQTFLNHNAVLFKVFVIGNKQFVVERPSIKNFSSRDHTTIFFDSNNVSKPNCANFLTELDAIDLDRTPVNPDIGRLQELGRVISQELQMELFGIDVIIDCETKKYAVIDINAFPGYEGVDNFIELLCDLLNSLMDNQSKLLCHGNETDMATNLKRPSDVIFDRDSDCTKRLKVSQTSAPTSQDNQTCRCAENSDRNANINHREQIKGCRGYRSDDLTSQEDDLDQYQESCDSISANKTSNNIEK
ncbi:hypothetical protein FSP39_023559, partial [Pinctada imbricata]